MRRTIRYCSFCGKKENEVARMVEGPCVVVCNECIDQMHSMIHKPPSGEVYNLRRTLRLVRADETQPSQSVR